MKKVLTKFAGEVLSREQMRAVKGGGGGYGQCNGACYEAKDCEVATACKKCSSPNNKTLGSCIS
jgi:natural product precursor